MGIITPCMTFSESGQPTGGGPCAELVRALSDKSRAEGRLVVVEAGAESNRKASAGMEKHLAAILLDNGRLRTALLAAVKMYGQPSGPWNVSGEPGEWIDMARKALKGE